MVWFGIFLTILMFVVFVHSIEKIKFDEFDDSSLWLMSFGIYLWGQGLLLAPFWMLFGIACIFWWTPATALSAYIWFHMIRAGAEIMMIRPKSYTGLAMLIMPSSDKIKIEDKLHLYALSQMLVIIAGGILLWI